MTGNADDLLRALLSLAGAQVKPPPMNKAEATNFITSAMVDALEFAPGTKELTTQMDLIADIMRKVGKPEDRVQKLIFHSFMMAMEAAHLSTLSAHNHIRAFLSLAVADGTPKSEIPVVLHRFLAKNAYPPVADQAPEQEKAQPDPAANAAPSEESGPAEGTTDKPDFSGVSG